MNTTQTAALPTPFSTIVFSAAPFIGIIREETPVWVTTRNGGAGEYIATHWQGPSFGIWVRRIDGDDWFSIAGDRLADVYLPLESAVAA